TLAVVLRFRDAAADGILLGNPAVPPPPKVIAQELRVQRGRREGRAPERYALSDHAPAELVEERQTAQLGAAIVQHPIEEISALDRVPNTSVLRDLGEELLRLLGYAHVGAELR